MELKVVETENAPAAIGPYSQGVVANGFVYVSGCLPIDMKTGALSTGDIAEMTRCSLRNVAAILEKAGSSLDKVVKTTVYVKNLGDFAVINSAYAEFFTGTAPARACVQVAALPKDAQIEIEAVAVL